MRAAVKTVFGMACMRSPEGREAVIKTSDQMHASFLAPALVLRFLPNHRAADQPQLVVQS